MKVLRLFIMTLVVIFMLVNMLQVVHAENSSEEIIRLSLDTNPELCYGEDAEGNKLGIKDFYINHERVYLLSSCNNTVYCCENNDIIEAIPFDEFGFVCTQIAGSEDYLFALDTNMTIYVIDERNIISRYDTNRLFHSEAVNEFACEGDYLTVGVEIPEKRASQRFNFKIQHNIFILNFFFLNFIVDI